jgi:crotonobetainyl-CoA:carnitine CoA-transferase CaiB-like acyl-CoA transferase
VFLTGVRVISLTHFLQGPSGVQFLADLGADVVKIEPPGRGAWERRWSGAETFLNGESVFFLLAHRNQRSMTVDLKSAKGKDVLWRLIGTADVLVENYRPGVMDRLGFGYEAVHRANTRIVYCACSGYGPDGPYRERPGQDLLLQAETGLARLTGGADAPPTPVGTAVVDQHGAALLAVGVLAALRGRDQTGAGCRVDVSLLAAALDLQIEPLTYYLNGGPLQPRSATGLATTFHEAPYGVYETRDGWVAVSLSSIARLAELTGSTRLAAYRDEERFSRREEISAAIGEALRTRTSREWLETLGGAGLWCAPVNGYIEVMADPQVQRAGTFLEVDHPRAGRVRLLAHPIRYNGEPPPLRRRPPLLGEDTDEVLRELGYEDDEIQLLRADGAV